MSEFEDEDLLLGVETAVAVGTAMEDSPAAADANEAEAAAAAPPLTAISPEVQLRLCRIILRLIGIVIPPADATETADTTSGPSLADDLRRKVYLELSGHGRSGAGASQAIVEANLGDIARSFEKRLSYLDGTAALAKSERKKLRVEDGSGDKKKSKKDKQRRKEKKRRSRFIDDMAGDGTESD